MAMNSTPGIDALLAFVCCPTCRGTLRTAPHSPDDIDRLQCAQCGSRWPLRFGIPDLRAAGVTDPYLSADEDLRAAERLHERALTGGFADALAAYYSTNERVSADQSRRFIAATVAAEDRSRAVLASWQARAPLAAAGRLTMLDAGCGTGPLLVAADSPNVQLIGIDVGMRWLVLAAARLRDRGVTAHLACAGTDHLPLANASCDSVSSESVIENVPSAGALLSEASRVLRPGGRLWLTTANRWSMGPDPHVGMPFGSWLPDRVVSAWARRRGMVPPRRRLLSARALRRLLEERGLRNVHLEPPPIAEAQIAASSRLLRLAVGGYRATARTTLGRAVLSRIGPSLLCVSTKPGVTQPVPTPP
jgi:ubiquinone/menaquinone biosynthesis C-methylase UbiE/uncharacterized protein YbaR (Trm112 family)